MDDNVKDNKLIKAIVITAAILFTLYSGLGAYAIIGYLLFRFVYRRLTND